MAQMKRWIDENEEEEEVQMKKSPAVLSWRVMKHQPGKYDLGEVSSSGSVQIQLEENKLVLRHKSQTNKSYTDSSVRITQREWLNRAVTSTNWENETEAEMI